MINSTLCYLERGDAYLMLHRVKKKGDLNHDKWIGVGGKFEDGESPEDCILRETWEEIGIPAEAIEILAPLIVDPGPSSDRVIVPFLGSGSPRRGWPTWPPARRR